MNNLMLNFKNTKNRQLSWFHGIWKQYNILKEYTWKIKTIKIVNIQILKVNSEGVYIRKPFDIFGNIIRIGSGFAMNVRIRVFKTVFDKEKKRRKP